ncbi:MAG TPA: class I SAM-dependent methyltransferase [Xanthobacteraceae bacterium]|nr:class I SAM-dependent methyltransferase [Xanthobacteraceae bacterium]
MSELFDRYDRSYGAVVQSSIDFSGLPHDFFLQAKADLMREKIAAHFGAKKPDGLDVGCGVGSFHPYVRELFARFCGADISEKSIDEARARRADVEYTAYDGVSLPYPAGSFDFVSAICVMHHVPPVQWPAFMAELRRVARAGGLIAVIEHNPFNPLTRLAVNRCEFDRDAVLLRASKTESLMKQAGLSRAASDYFLFFPVKAEIALRTERGLRKLPLGAQYMTCGEA